LVVFPGAITASLDEGLDLFPGQLEPVSLAFDDVGWCEPGHGQCENSRTIQKIDILSSTTNVVIDRDWRLIYRGQVDSIRAQQFVVALSSHSDAKGNLFESEALFQISESTD